MAVNKSTTVKSTKVQIPSSSNISHNRSAKMMRPRGSRETSLSKRHLARILASRRQTLQSSTAKTKRTLLVSSRKPSQPPRRYKVQNCGNIQLTKRYKMLTRLQKANQLFKLQIEPVTPENIRAPVLEVSSLLTTVSPAADDDGRRPEAQLASSQPESIYDASSDAAQSASVRSVDSQPVSEVSTALTTPDMSDCEGKDNAASTSAQQPRPQPVVPTTQQLVVIARPASPVASRQQPKPRQPIKARLLGEAATQIKSDTPTPLIITSNLPSPKVKQRKGLVSSAAALTTTTTPAVPSSPPKKRKRDLPDTAPLPIPSPAVPLPQAKKRKPTPVDAAREDGSPEPYFKARIREMLTDPDHDDCVFEIPLQRRQRDMQRRQVEFRGFRKYQGTKNCPEMSGATGEPSGAEPKSHGKGKGKGKASAQTKAAPSVPTPNDGGIMLGALPGEPRWKKHIYHGPGGVNFW